MPLVGYLAIGRLISALIGLATLRLLTEYLSPEEVGRVYIFTAIALGGTLALISPAGSFVVRHAVEWQLEGRLSSQVNEFTKYLFLASIFSIFFTFLFIGNIQNITIVNIWFIITILIGRLLIVEAVQHLLLLINTIGKQITYIVLSIGRESIALCCATVAAITFSPTAESWMIGIVVGNFVLLPLVRSLLYRANQSAPTARRRTYPAPSFWSTRAFAFSWPVALSTSFYWLQTSGFRLPFSALSNEETLGFFTVGFTLGALPIILFERLMQEYLTPGFFRKTAHADVKEKILVWRNLNKTYLTLALVTSALIAGVAPALAVFMVDEAYWRFAWIANSGALFQCLIMVTGSFNLLARSASQTRFMILPHVFGGLVAVVGISILSPSNPLVGAAIVIPLSALATVLVAARNARASTGAVPDWFHLVGAIPFVAACYLVPMGLTIAIGPLDAIKAVIVIFVSIFIWSCSIIYLLNKNILDKKLLFGQNQA